MSTKRRTRVSNVVALPLAQPKFLTSAETAALLRVDRRTLRRYTKKRLITFIKRGGGCLFPVTEIERFLNNRTVRAA